MPSRLGISSMSLGRAWVHSLESKLDAAAAQGIEGIELFYEDLQYVAKTLPGGPGRHNEIAAAKLVARWCKQRALTVICLQPCWCDEGLLDRHAWADKLEDIRHRIRVAHALGTDLLLIPSSINVPADQLSSSLDLMAADLREIADLGAAEGVRFAHESLCWGTRSDDWETSWDLVRRVDRPNFGICLDTFNIAGRVFADPTSPDGQTPDGRAALTRSLAHLRASVDVAKVFLVQVVDAERLSAPLLPGHEFHVDGQPPRMSWSRNCRLFYGEQERGAYLPVREVAEAIFTGLGCRGWISMELFNRSMADKGAAVPQQHARRAHIAWTKLVEDCDIDDAMVKVASPPTPQQQQAVRRDRPAVSKTYSTLLRHQTTGGAGVLRLPLFRSKSSTARLQLALNPKTMPEIFGTA